MQAEDAAVRYRSDINGLRAIAVIAVVLFHFKLAGAEGGYVGVDVFFVISGFLMTNIIFSKLEKERFSLLAFYMDRARRIIPALGFMCVFLLAAGWLLLFPQEYEQLAKRVLGSLGFVSNLQYWKEAGYFEQVSHDNWLLHTWSLSVEWQFYLIYPVIILLLRKLFPLALTRWMLALFALGSLALSVYASSRWPTSAFYLLPTRMWEMLFGGLAFLFPMAFSKRGSLVLEMVGIALIVLAVGLFTADTPWPGWLALIPVTGTVMIIYSARHASFITANPVAQFLGNISYSLYLWHWPVAVGIYYFGLEHHGGWVVFGMLASLCLGWISYRYVENVARTSAGFIPFVQSRVAAALPVAVASVLAGVTLVAQGYPDRVSETFSQATASLVLPTKENGWCFHDVETNPDNQVGEGGLECLSGAPEGKRKALLFGDSFAGHYQPFWDEIGREKDIAINTVSTNWCYPSIDKKFTGITAGPGYQQCLINRAYLEREADSYDIVVFAGQWGAVQRLGLMDSTYSAIKMASQRADLVIIMASPSTFDVDISKMYKRSVRFNTEFDVTRFQQTRDAPASEANDLLATYAQGYPNVMYFSRESMFNVNGVPSDVTDENVPFGLDTSGHISLYGSLKAAEAFQQSILYRQFSARL